MAITPKHAPAPTSAHASKTIAREVRTVRRRVARRRSSVLSATTARYVEDRLSRADAIAAVVASTFNSVATERCDGAICGALREAHYLIVEAVFFVHQSAERKAALQICVSDPWWADLLRADALFTIVTRAHASHFLESVSAEVAGGYFSSLRGITTRTLDGLRSALSTEEVCHA